VDRVIFAVLKPDWFYEMAAMDRLKDQLALTLYPPPPFFTNPSIFGSFDFLVGIMYGILEVPDRLAESAAYLRQFASSKKNQDNEHDNDKFLHSQSEHIFSPLMNSVMKSDKIG